MRSVRLDIPEDLVITLVEQLSPAGKQAVLQMLVPEFSETDELDALEDAFFDDEDFDEDFLWEVETFGDEVGMDRRYLLAAETFHYSYANYDGHLGIGNVRFDELMPNDVDILDLAEEEGWDDSRLADALEIDKELVPGARRSYRRAIAIVDAPTPAESFRRGVGFSIEDAVENGLTDEQEIEDLVTQICYRAADLAYLLNLRRERLSDYSEELRQIRSG
jgi:hypothetical protein